MDDTTLIALPAVLALELADGVALPQLTLSRDLAAELAGLITTDVQNLVPAATGARLAVVGALFDAVELLRPGFPVWATLDELARRVPRGRVDNVVAFGTHEGHMPAQPLEPQRAYADGPMRFLPISLLASQADAAALSDALEIELVGRGEAGARTADWLMRTLGVPLEHVRYLSRNDVLALTCVQYEHASLAALWTLLEAALLTPYREETALTARGLALTYRSGRIEAQSPAAWLAGQTGGLAQRGHDLAAVVFELRQYAALLHAHALPLQLAHNALPAGDGYLAEHLADRDAAYDAPSLVAHEAPGLGIVAVTVTQRGEGGRARSLAHGYPLQPGSLGPLVAMLAQRYGSATDVLALGTVVIDDNGGLGAPDTPLH